MVRNEKGVTLVELLIVIVILGIIAAISVPAVGNIVSNAEKDALLSDATNIESAIDLYCTSEDDPEGEDPCEGDIYFSNVDNIDDADRESLGDYLEDFDGTYVVYYSDGSDDYDEGDLVIAISDADNQYSYVGTVADAERDLVIDDTDSDDYWNGTTLPEGTDADWDFADLTS